jgi:transcriptional regulator with XRE-family HTH domain
MEHQRQRSNSQAKGNADVSGHAAGCTTSQPDGTPATSELPDSFWLAEPLQRAIQAHDFGQLLRVYREAHYPVLSQGTIADLLGITQGQVSRIERGITPVRDLTKLDQWTQALHIPEQYLWFKYHSETCTPPVSRATLEASAAKEDNDDVHRRQLLQTAGLGAALLGSNLLASDATNLTSTRPDDNHPLNVDFMRDATDTFRRLDNQYGGGYCRAMVNAYITTDVTPKLQSGRYSHADRRELFTAVAELHQLAGWMAYDMGDTVNGREHLHQALSLCRDIRDDAFAAELMAAMSHHAAFYRSADSAVDMALAAQQTASRTGLAALRSEAAALHAGGLALQGNARACIVALQRAEKEFMAVRPNESPTWLRYYDEAYLSAKFAHALRDLGRAADAERFARRSLEMSEGYERGRLFNTALLASILANQGKVEEATTYASLAVQMSKNMRSTRTVAYLRDTGQGLLPYRKHAAVQRVHHQMKAAGIAVQRSF